MKNCERTHGLRNILTVCFFICVSCTLACSGHTKPFCFVHSERPIDLVVSGKIIASDSLSIQLEVIEVLSGAESRSVITIWNDEDFDCNGMVSMKASGMGNLHDTIIAILPRIDAVKYHWDVAGDYRRPEHLFTESVLMVQSDTIRGVINGNPAPSAPYWRVMKMQYAEFRDYWLQHQGDCTQLVSTKEEILQIPEITFYDNQVRVTLAENVAHQITLMSLHGGIIRRFDASENIRINLANYPSGMYFVNVVSKSGQQFGRKVIR